MAGNLCAFKNCSNSRNKVKGLKMFVFPRDDETAKIWIIISGNPDLAALSIASLRKKLLCEQHFRQEDILPSGRLMRGALPQLYTPTGCDAESSTETNTSSPSPHVEKSLMSPSQKYAAMPLEEEKPSPTMNNMENNEDEYEPGGFYTIYVKEEKFSSDEEEIDGDVKATENPFQLDEGYCHASRESNIGASAPVLLS